jgi:hypothetical protein
MKLNPGKKVIFVVPFVTLSRAQTTNITKACGGNRVHVQFYKDPTPKGADSTWDVLVVCPMSLHKFNLANIGLLVVDELSAVGTQLVGWVDEKGETGERLSRAVDLLKCLAQQVTTVVLCGAQADAFERERMLALLGIDPSVAMLMYEHIGDGPVIPVARLESTDHAINFMWHYYEQGLKVAIHFRHASDVDCVAVYAQAKAEECGLRAPVLLKWTRESLANYKASPHPAADVTKYLQATRPEIMAYTTALSPGMSIDDDDLIDVRIMVEPSVGSGAGDKVIGQMPGRFRKVKNQLVLISAPNIGTQKDNGDAIMAMLATTRGADTHTRLSDQGDAECVLKEGLLNDLKLEAFVYASKGISFDGILPHIGKTHVVAVPNPGGVVVSSEPDPLWRKIRKEQGHDDPDSPIHHFTKTEFECMCMRSGDSYAHMLDKSKKAMFTARMLPRRFVTSGAEWVLDSGRLSNRSFNLVIAHYNQFFVMQLFVFSAHTASTTVDGRQLISQVAAECGVPAHTVACDADLAVDAIRHLCTLASLSVTPSLSLQRYEAGDTASAKAYTWLADKWEKVRTFSTRSAVLPHMPPNRNDDVGWERCMKRIFKAQLGVGIKKQKLRKNEQVARYTLTPGSLWKTLGVNLAVYTQWLLGEEAAMVTLSPRVCVPCELCDHDGGPVECVFQGGVARCAGRSSLDCDAHRSLGTPLDVGPATEFTDRMSTRNTVQAALQLTTNIDLPAPPVCTLISAQGDQEGTEVDNALVDRLLQFMGFIDGTKTKAPVTVGDILLAVTTHPLPLLEEQTRVQLELQLSLLSLREWRNARQVTPVLRRLSTKAGFKITSRLLSRNAADSRSYTITQ